MGPSLHPPNDCQDHFSCLFPHAVPTSGRSNAGCTGGCGKLSSEDLNLWGLGGWMEGICTPGMYVLAWEFGGSDGTVLHLDCGRGYTILGSV